MRSNTRNYILTAVSAVAILLLCPALQATSSITLTATPYTYLGQSVGPYSAQITNGTVQNLLVFCLDGDRTFSPTTGTLTPFSSLSSGQSATLNQREEEAAFLAAYSLYLDPAHTNINVVEGPIQLAIWSIMNSMPTGLTINSATQGYINQAVAMVTQHPTLFAPNSAFMSTVSIWIPTNWPVNNQRFITVGPLTPPILNATPEPGTLVFLGTGVLLMALSRIRRRR